MGVDLFFVLSGYLVSGLLFGEYQKTGKIRPIRFLIRRGMKIYPSFYALILFSFIFNLAGPKPRLNQVLSEIFYVQNYFPGIWGHTWSLAVEEQFYILLVIVVILLVRSRKENPLSSIPRLVVIVCLACLSIRLVTYYFHPYYEYRVNYTPTHMRLDALAFGVLISYLRHFHRPRYEAFIQAHYKILLIFGVLLILPAFLKDIKTYPFIYTAGYTLIYLGSGMILMAVTAVNLRQTGLLRFMGFIGKHSYNIYLWHLPVRSFLNSSLMQNTAVQSNSYVYILTFATLGIMVGIFWSLTLEAYFLKLRDRFFPSGQQAL